MTAPTADITAEMIKALRMPSTNTRAARPKVDGLTPIKRAERVALEMKLAKTALIIARLSDWPKNLMVFNVPEAMPSLLFSTEPMTALVLGDEKRPIPDPMTKSLMATSAGVEARFKVLVHKSPAHIRAMPDEANTREPILSESQPLSGDRTAMVTGITKSITPACNADSFKAR